MNETYKGWRVLRWLFQPGITSLAKTVRKTRMLEKMNTAAMQAAWGGS